MYASGLHSSRLNEECSAWLDVYAANIGVGVELVQLHNGPQAALTLVEDAREYARCTERSALVRFLSALRVSALLACGQVEEAGRAWQVDQLPEQAAECTDLRTQSWREAEILICARLQLFIACGAFNAGRELSTALEVMAAERCLVRTSMRGLALLMVLEHQAKDDDHARAHLVDYIRLFAEADYVRPLARIRTVALVLLDDVANDPRVDPVVVEAAAGLRDTILDDDAGAGEDPSPRALSDRELDILARLEQRHRDKDIAKALNLSYDGVRYHIRNIFAKLGARGRFDAVHRARERGILSPATDILETGS